MYAADNSKIYYLGFPYPSNFSREIYTGLKYYQLYIILLKVTDINLGTVTLLQRLYWYISISDNVINMQITIVSAANDHF